MHLPIILFDNSCAKFAKQCEKIYKNKQVVIGIGGGHVIDMAKILALPNPCIAYPTTASGAAFTSHAVIWTKTEKINVPTPRPIYKKYPYKIKLSKSMAAETACDCFAHCIDSLESPKATKESRRLANMAMELLNKKKLIEAGNLAGKAIDITGTGLIHQLSYPLTIHLGMKHGRACFEALQWVFNEKA